MRLSRRTALAVASTLTVLVAPLLPQAVGPTSTSAPVVKSGPASTTTHKESSTSTFDVYFVRHAHSTYPEPEQELSPRGIAEAAALVDGLRQQDVTSVTTSLMLRAFQTGDGVAAVHNLPVTADPRLNELSLQFDGDLTGQEKADAYLRVMRDWIEGRDRSTRYGEENYYDVARRWNGWWSEYAASHRGLRGTGVVVAHGAVLGVMLPGTCDNGVSADLAIANALPNTGIVRARLHRNGRLTCTEWAGVPLTSKN